MYSIRCSCLAYPSASLPAAAARLRRTLDPCPPPPQVRAYFGIQPDPRTPQLDLLTRLFAGLFLLYALWVAATGRRLAVGAPGVQARR